MKRIAFIFALIVVEAATAGAQKFAIIDSEYILKIISAYEKLTD